MPKHIFTSAPSGLYVRFLIPKHVREGTGTRYVIRSLAAMRGDAAQLTAARLGYRAAIIDPIT